MGRCTKTVDFRKTKGGVHSLDMEAPKVEAGEFWNDDSFPPDMAMKGMIEEGVELSDWPIWKRSKVKKNILHAV